MKTRLSLLATTATVCMLSCVQAPVPDAGIALFGSFSYSGADTCYTHHPLTEENAFYNPILPGWYSDPSVCTNGKGDYFLVTSTFSYYPGVPIFHSRDLMHWEQVGHVLDRPSQLRNLPPQHVSGGIFAPAIEYNPHNETYYMVTTNVGWGNFFVTTKDPFGEWSEPIRLPTVGGIDPSFFFDDDGRAYIVNNDDAPDRKAEYDGHRTIRIQEFDPATNRTVGNRKILVNKGARPEDNPIWIEGPHMYKINGKYYLMSAEGGTGGWHSEVIFRSDSPMGPFEPWEKNPILTQRHLDHKRSYPITCAGHADLVQAKEGDWWAVFLACRPIENKFENLGRETFIMPVKWSDDGFPYMTQGDDIVPLIVHRDGVKRQDGYATVGNFTHTDEFADTLLAQDWHTLRGPATEHYSLTAVPGYLALKCAPKLSTERGTPAFVGRRMQHHAFESSTDMLFAPADTLERAGMVLFKDETHQYLFIVGYDGTNKYISLEKVGRQGTEALARHALTEQNPAITLKVVSDGKHYAFHYATKKGRWQTLAEEVDAAHLSTARAGGFTGSLIGLYATNK